MIGTILLTILGLIFIGNAALEGGVGIGLGAAKKEHGGAKQTDILFSLLIAGILLTWGYVRGLTYSTKEDLFVCMVSCIIAVYIITRTYFTK